MATNWDLCALLDTNHIKREISVCKPNLSGPTSCLGSNNFGINFFFGFTGLSKNISNATTRKVFGDPSFEKKLIAKKLSY